MGAEDSEVMIRLKAAEKRFEEQQAATSTHKEELQAAQAAMSKLCGRGGLGSTTVKPATEIASAKKVLQGATATVTKAVEEQRRCEQEMRTAKAKAMREHPDLFLKPDPSMSSAMGETGMSDEPLTTIGLLFPGQGSQYVKMMLNYKDRPDVMELVRTAEKVLGWDPLDICLNGPEEKLGETNVCQPCMFLASMAGLAKLKETRPEAVDRPGCVAGLSLGEYTALCAAGVFTFEQGMELVKVRGEAMSEAATTRPQAMLSVFGLDQETLENLCKEQAIGSEVCQIANVLFPRGFSCSGTAGAIDKLKDACDTAGAMQAKLLKTSGAFHTEMMQPAQLKLQAALDKLLPEMKPPKCPVYMNITGKKIPAGTDPKEIVPLLAKQLCSSVLWEPSVLAMIEDGLTEFYEIGPMKQLKAMMKRIDMNMWSATQNIEV